jgi:hypothetical protein
LVCWLRKLPRNGKSANAKESRIPFQSGRCAAPRKCSSCSSITTAEICVPLKSTATHGGGGVI